MEGVLMAAKNDKGTSVLPTAEEHTALRRAAKAKRRGAKGSFSPSETLQAGIAADRRARREQQYRQEFFNDVMRHIQNAATRNWWVKNEVEEARIYLNSLVFEDVQFVCIFEKVEREVQRRFALGCVRNSKMTGMPGQSQDWYPQALQNAQAFWSSRSSSAPQHDLQPA